MTDEKGALLQFLQGKDLRSTGNVDELIALIQSQEGFNELFSFLNSSDRIVVMRTADAMEKISRAHPEFLQPHKNALVDFLESACDKEFKWHLAQMVSRLNLSADELGRVWNKLSIWATDRKESRIVRVHSLQSLCDLMSRDKNLEQDFELTLKQVSTENIPSIIARTKKLRKQMEKQSGRKTYK